VGDGRISIHHVYRWERMSIDRRAGPKDWTPDLEDL